MFEEMLEKLGGGGWSDLDGLGDKFGKMAREQGAAERQEIERQTAIFAETFGSDAGKKALDILLRMTLWRQPDEEERAARTNAQAYAIAKARREGENSIIFLLLARLQLHGERQRQAAEKAKTETPEHDRATAPKRAPRRSRRRKQSGGEL